MSLTSTTTTSTTLTTPRSSINTQSYVVPGGGGGGGGQGSSGSPSTQSTSPSGFVRPGYLKHLAPRNSNTTATQDTKLDLCIFQILGCCTNTGVINGLCEKDCTLFNILLKSSQKTITIGERPPTDPQYYTQTITELRNYIYKSFPINNVVYISMPLPDLFPSAPTFDSIIIDRCNNKFSDNEIIRRRLFLYRFFANDWTTPNDDILNSNITGQVVSEEDLQELNNQKIHAEKWISKANMCINANFTQGPLTLFVPNQSSLMVVPIAETTVFTQMMVNLFSPSYANYAEKNKSIEPSHAIVTPGHIGFAGQNHFYGGEKDSLSAPATLPTMGINHIVRSDQLSKIDCNLQYEFKKFTTVMTDTC